MLMSARALLSVNMNPEIECMGKAALPIGTLFGAVYSPLAGFNVCCLQKLVGHPAERWSHELHPAEYPVVVHECEGDRSSTNIVLAVGVSADVRSAVKEAMDRHSITARKVVYVEPASGPLRKSKILSPEDGKAVALKAIDEIRGVKDRCGFEQASLHLFQACPFALSVLIGQQLNTFSSCVLYEHVPSPDQKPVFSRVHEFNPSGFTYSR